MASSSSHRMSGISTFDFNQRWICWHPHIQINVSTTTFYKICYWTLSTIHCCFRWVMFFSSRVNCNNSVLISGWTCYRLIQTSWPCGTCWIEDPSLSTVLNMLEEIPMVKDLIRDVSIDQVLKGLLSMH